MDILKEQLADKFTANANITEDKWKVPNKERPIKHKEPSYEDWPNDVQKPKKLEAIKDDDIEHLHATVAQQWTAIVKQYNIFTDNPGERYAFQNKYLLYSVAKRLWEENGNQYKELTEQNIQEFTLRVVTTYAEIYNFYTTKSQSVPGMGVKGTYQELDELAWQYGTSRYKEVQTEGGKIVPKWVETIRKSSVNVNQEIFENQYAHLHKRAIGSYVKGVTDALFEKTETAATEEPATHTDEAATPPADAGPTEKVDAEFVNEEEAPTAQPVELSTSPQATPVNKNTVLATREGIIEGAPQLPGGTTETTNRNGWHNVKKEPKPENTGPKVNKINDVPPVATEGMTPEEKIQAAADAFLEAELAQARTSGKYTLELKLQQILDAYHEELLKDAGNNPELIRNAYRQTLIREQQIRQKYSYLFQEDLSQPVTELVEDEDDNTNTAPNEDIEEGVFS